MADTNIEFTNEGIALLNATPFFPNTYYEDGTKYVIFNQGYVINYGSTDDPQNILGTEGFLSTIKVGEIGPYEIVGGEKFYVEIQTGGISSAITRANIVKYGTPNDVASNFHYGVSSATVSTDAFEGTEAAQDLGAYNGEGIFRVPLCYFDDNLALNSILLRENIHWQKIGFVSVGQDFSWHPAYPDETDQIGIGFASVLSNWGDSSTSFGINPNVQFKSLKAGGGIEITEYNNTIIIKNTKPETDTEPDDTGSGSTTQLSLSAYTSDATPTPITSTSTGVSIPLNVDSSISFEGTVVAREEGSSSNGGQSTAWNIRGSAARGSTTAQVVASQVTQIAYGLNSNYSLKISAGEDLSDFGVAVKAIGEAGKNLSWSASINYSSTNY